MVRLHQHNPKLNVVLLWFRRDLRTVDNPALTAALQIAKHVVCPTGLCLTVQTWCWAAKLAAVI